jgi:glutathione S-transferase
MYTLYYSPGTCSLATHVLMNELKLDVNLLEKSKIDKFENINPAGTVPVLGIDKTLIQEGAAIALFLMEKHKSNLLPEAAESRSKAIQWMMFANASVHPAYSKLFFASKNISNPEAKNEVIDSASERVNELWSIVNDQLGTTKYLTGESLSMADIMLSVYANWNNYFPGKIKLGDNSIRMIKEVSSREAFKKSIQMEKIKYNVQ